MDGLEKGRGDLEKRVYRPRSGGDVPRPVVLSKSRQELGTHGGGQGVDLGGSDLSSRAATRKIECV